MDASKKDKLENISALEIHIFTIFYMEKLRIQGKGQECAPISNFCQVRIGLPTLVLKPRGDVTRNPNRAPKMDMCPTKILEKNFHFHAVFWDKMAPLALGLRLPPSPCIRLRNLGSATSEH